MSEFIEIKTKIEQSDSKESIEESIINQIKIAEEILEWVKNFPELESKFKNNYENLRKIIIDSIESENKITDTELTKIKQEFEKLNNLSNQEINNILLNKNIKDFSINDAEIALIYLQNNYKNYSKANSFWLINKNASIINLKNKNDVNLFQKELLNIIYKVDWDTFYHKWFNDKFLAWFDKEKWNYVISIEEFRKKLFNPNSNILWDINNPNTIDYIEYKNYLSYIQNIEWISYINKNNIKQLEKYFPKHLFENLLDTKDKLERKYELFWWSSDKIKSWEYMLIADMLTDEDFSLIAEMEKQKIPKEEILKYFFKKYKNLDLEKKLIDYKTQNKEYYDNEAKKELENNKWNLNDDIKLNLNHNLDIFERNDWTTYDRKSWKIEYKNETIVLNDFEKNIIERDPSNLDNIIDFYEIFKDLNLVSVWNYRNKIIIALWKNNIKWNDDWLRKEEIINFGKDLIQFLNNLILSDNTLDKKEQLKKSNSLSWIKNELKKYSKANWVLSNDKSFNNFWEDRFASDLRNLWIIWNSLWFQINKFSEILNWENIKKAV